MPFNAARQDGCEVNCLVVPEAKIAEKRRYLGGFWRAVVRDGVVIAGEWQNQNKGERLLMDKMTFLRHLGAAHKRMVSGAQAYRLIGTDGRPSFVRRADDSGTHAPNVAALLKHQDELLQVLEGRR